MSAYVRGGCLCNGLLHVLHGTGQKCCAVWAGASGGWAGLWRWPTWGRRWPLATSLRGIRCAGLPGSGLRKCLPEQGTAATMFVSLSLLSLLVATSGVSMRWQVIFMPSELDRMRREATRAQSRDHNKASQQRHCRNVSASKDGFHDVPCPRPPKGRE